MEMDKVFSQGLEAPVHGGNSNRTQNGDLAIRHPSGFTLSLCRSAAPPMVEPEYSGPRPFAGQYEAGPTDFHRHRQLIVLRHFASGAGPQSMVAWILYPSRWDAHSGGHSNLPTGNARRAFCSCRPRIPALPFPGRFQGIRTIGANVDGFTLVDRQASGSPPPIRTHRVSQRRAQARIGNADRGLAEAVDWHRCSDMDYCVERHHSIIQYDISKRLYKPSMYQAQFPDSPRNEFMDESTTGKDTAISLKNGMSNNSKRNTK